LAFQLQSMAKSSNSTSSISSKRLDQMIAGLEELDNWLQDTFRQGLASLEQQPFSFWKEISTRMVDAKLGGIGKRLTRLSTIIGQQQNWHELVLEELSSFYLLIRGIRNLAQLPTPLQTDLLQIAGVNTRKEDLFKNGIHLQDTWMTLALSHQEEDNLRSRKTWLYGWTSHRYALVLDFAWGRTDFTNHYEAGKVFTGTVVYYPSNTPLRVVVKEKRQLDKKYIKRIVGFPSFTEFLHHYATNLANNPWLTTHPCALEEVTPTLDKDTLILLDSDNYIIPTSISPPEKWQIIAMSGGHPINLFGEWTGKVFIPLSASIMEQFCVL